jgi:hypothetical protein
MTGMNKKRSNLLERMKRWLVMACFACLVPLQGQVAAPLAEGLRGAAKATWQEGNDVYVLYATDNTAFQEKYEVARWNGLYWTYYPGLNAPSIVTSDQGSYRFTSVAVYRDTLYAGGMLADATSAFPVNHLYRWNGQAWEVIGGAIQTLNNGISDMLVYQGKLIVAGLFDEAQGKTASNITQYQNGIWSYIGPSSTEQGTNGRIRDLFVHEGRLYIGGEFSLVGQNITGNTAFWTGTLWGGIGNPFRDYTIQLAASSDSLYALGIESGSASVKRFTGTGWMDLKDSFSSLNRFEPEHLNGKPGLLVLTGQFRSGSTDASALALDPSVRLLPMRVNGPLNGVHFFGDKLLVYGGFTQPAPAVFNWKEGHALVRGTLYQELQENCRRDADEKPLAGRTVIAASGAKQYVAITDTAGYFEFILPAGTWLFSAGPRKYWSPACGDPQLSLVAGDTRTFEHGLRLAPNRNDMRVKLNAANPLGADADGRMRYEIVFENLGSTVISGATVHFTHDTRMQQFRSEPQAANYQNPEAVWTVDNLQAGERRRIRLSLLPPAGIAPSLLQPAAVRTGSLFTASDLDLSDNRDSVHYQTFASGTDGNMKSASPEDRILPGTEEIVYTIHFRNNEGYKTARFSITDTIDVNLPLQYLETVSWSHDYRLRVVDGRVAVFTMDPGVLYPYEQSDTLSRGWFSYKIKVRKGLAVGTKIENTAQIAFDSYGQRRTNTTVHTYFDPTVGVVEPGYFSGMRFYPNPVSGFLQVQSLTGKAQGFTITGMDGRNWMQFRLEGGTQQAIDMRHMPAGIYVLSGEGESRKIILSGNP